MKRLDWRAFLRHANPLANALPARLRIPKQERVRAKLEALTALVGLWLTAARLQHLSERLSISQLAQRISMRAMVRAFN